MLPTAARHHLVRARRVLRRDGLRGVARKALARVPALAATLAPIAGATSARVQRLPRLAANPAPVESQLLLPRYLVRGDVGMTTPHEQAYFHWHARELYRGDGVVVDLGSWLGSTTTALARGVVDGGRRVPLPAIHAFDRFMWEDWMQECVLDTGLAGTFAPGDSFVEAFRVRVEPWSAIVAVHAADLTEATWDGSEIELLLIDAMKSWELARAIAREFYGPLRPGAWLIHQDFAHYYTPWIHLTGFRLRNYLEPFYDVPRSGTLSFRVRTHLPAEEAAGWGRDSFGPEEVDAAFRHSLALVAPEKRASILAARIMLALNDGDVELARHELDRVGADGYSPSGELALVGRLVSEAEGRGGPRRDAAAVTASAKATTLGR